MLNNYCPKTMLSTHDTNLLPIFGQAKKAVLKESDEWDPNFHIT